MDFGKLARVDHIRFDLPSEDARNSVLLNQRFPNPNLGVYIGGPVWTCPQWIGKVYPPDIRPRDYLHAYAQQFNSIELNSSFYRIPNVTQVQSWRNSVPPDFKFAPKLHQDISHFKTLALAQEALKVFWECISHFEENLGLCFLQLPPHLDFQYWSSIQRILEQVPDPRKLAVEFRHSSWFNQRTLRPEVFDYFLAKEISAVMTDVAGRRDVLHSSVPTRRVLIRFTGNELHPSDFARIDLWVGRLLEWIRKGIEEIYFFIHQPTEAEVPELVQDLVELLNARGHLSLRSWSPTQKPALPSNEQMSLF